MKNSSFIFIDEKKIVKGKKTCSCSAIAFFLPLCLHCLLFSLRHWSSLYLFVRHDVSLYLSLFLSSLSLPLSILVAGGGVWKIIAEKLLSEQNAVSSHVILVCMLHIVLPCPSSSASPFNS